MSDSLWPHGLQHARLSCPSLRLRVCSNLCPLSRWCHPTISSSVIPFSSCPQSFPASMNQFFTWDIMGPNYGSFSFSISPSHEYSGLISFRIDLFWSPGPRDSQKSSPAPQFETIISSLLSLLYELCFSYLSLGVTHDVRETKCHSFFWILQRRLVFNDNCRRWRFLQHQRGAVNWPLLGPGSLMYLYS